jgi:hypothetical protein
VRPFERRHVILEPGDALVHLRFEMREAAEQLGLQHQLDLGARIGDAPLDVEEAPLKAMRGLAELQQQRPLLPHLTAQFPQDRQHQTVVGFRHLGLP